MGAAVLADAGDFHGNSGKAGSRVNPVQLHEILLSIDGTSAHHILECLRKVDVSPVRHFVGGDNHGLVPAIGYTTALAVGHLGNQKKFRLWIRDTGEENDVLGNAVIRELHSWDGH